MVLRFNSGEIEMNPTTALSKAVLVPPIASDGRTFVILGNAIIGRHAVLSAKNMQNGGVLGPALAARCIRASCLLGNEEFDDDIVLALLPTDDSPLPPIVKYIIPL